eukprot:4752001-Pleurochrysis_carterae.AAC.1
MSQMPIVASREKFGQLCSSIQLLSNTLAADTAKHADCVSRCALLFWDTKAATSMYLGKQSAVASSVVW